MDASTLILLAKIDLLREVVEGIDVVIPPRVRAESLAKQTFEAALIRALLEEGRVKVEKVGQAKAVRKLMADFRIERGEAEALCLSMKKNVVLAVDDGPTIKACRVLNVRFSTAIHFLIHLKLKGQLDADVAMAKLEKLGFFGRYSSRILEDARRRIMEG